jgi:pilus assembly protein CpaF
VSERTRRFPAPIPNPAAGGTSDFDEDDKTDPGIAPPPVSGSLGPLEVLMRDPAVTEIMVNDTRDLTIEKDGKLLPAGFLIRSRRDLDRLVESLAAAAGKEIGEDHPWLDGTLPGGARLHIVVPPIAVNGPSITIRKFPARTLSLPDLVQRETLDQRMAQFLAYCVAGRRNFLISGGTGSGKTTLLNALAAYVPKTERLVTIEDTPELVLNHPNSVRLQTKLADAGPARGGSDRASRSGPLWVRDLVANALRMRPDRIIVGECRRSEALDMLQAMNTGHQGSMTTIHANSTRDALTRLETLCMMTGVEIPLPAIRKQIAQAIDVIIHVQRLRSGPRKILSVAELTGMEGDVITTQDLFAYDVDRNAFRGTTLIPTFLDDLKDYGIDVPRSFFA